MTSFLTATLSEDKQNEIQEIAQEKFEELIQDEQYVGEVYSTGYETNLVLIHDKHRMNVGGIPSLSFLIATRVDPTQPVNFTEEDASVILLRVMDAAPLPNAGEAERIRVESAQRVSGEASQHWEESATMDAHTSDLLSFAGVKCRVIGTFFLDRAEPTDPESSDLTWRFGDDISNYYPNRGLKVYKPSGAALSKIVNYRDMTRFEGKTPKSFNIGEVRYASTNRPFQKVNDVSVDMIPEDLLGQKTAVFGMTRMGKSNTTKIILQSVFHLRFDATPKRIGQVVFDPNGEYANENVQDASGEHENQNAIKNVWKSHQNGKADDVVTYGIHTHPNDKNRRIMLINFYHEDNLQIGKELINAVLTEEKSIYTKNFRQVGFTKQASEFGKSTRYERRVLAYRALLSKAGFTPPKSLDKPRWGNLFNKDLRKALSDSGKEEFANAAEVFASKTSTWPQLVQAFESLARFLDTSEYKAFNNNYIKGKSKSANDAEEESVDTDVDESWADDDLQKILTMFVYVNGSRLIGKAREQHTPDTNTDYAADIYQDLVDGKLVIIDQASGNPEINKASAERIMWHIFLNNQSTFREGKDPLSMILYVEEAHNLLPAGSDLDTQDIWVRTAKEGAKYNIGMVYATQEVSSIQKNILKNTANWFIGHLNNTDETRELCKYYDFADFEKSIRRAQDRGFLRIKTLSNRFVIPVQIKQFKIESA
ncbi:MAG: DUF87 domain-containing protein [Trueperaceae bacterium]|nr:DUF87 domain-containing protein [Trueperaceae bacterium]